MVCLKFSTKLLFEIYLGLNCLKGQSGEGETGMDVWHWMACIL